MNGMDLPATIAIGHGSAAKTSVAPIQKAAGGGDTMAEPLPRDQKKDRVNPLDRATDGE
jgi:hypothetical protein